MLLLIILHFFKNLNLLIAAKAEARNLLQETTSIPTISVDTDRFGISNSAAAFINTTTLVDYEMIYSDDKTNIFYHKNVHRALEKKFGKNYFYNF